MEVEATSLGSKGWALAFIALRGASLSQGMDQVGSEIKHMGLVTDRMDSGIKHMRPLDLDHIASSTKRTGSGVKHMVIPVPINSVGQTVEHMGSGVFESP